MDQNRYKHSESRAVVADANFTIMLAVFMGGLLCAGVLLLSM